jgi:hypothetical protein
LQCLYAMKYYLPLKKEIFWSVKHR